MDIIPAEIESNILDFIFSDYCYLNYKNSNDIKKCACVNKNFNKKFKCKPFFIEINKNYLEFCYIHDKVLLENLKRILFKVIDNYSNPIDFYVNLIIDDTETRVALTDFYLEPYIGLLDMNYIYHSFSFEELNNSQIRKLISIIARLFEYLELKFSTSSFGVNAFHLEQKKEYLDNIINKNDVDV